MLIVLLLVVISRGERNSGEFVRRELLGLPEATLGRGDLAPLIYMSVLGSIRIDEHIHSRIQCLHFSFYLVCSATDLSGEELNLY